MSSPKALQAKAPRGMRAFGPYPFNERIEMSGSTGIQQSKIFSPIRVKLSTGACRKAPNGVCKTNVFPSQSSEREIMPVNLFSGLPNEHSPLAILILARCLPNEQQVRSIRDVRGDAVVNTGAEGATIHSILQMISSLVFCRTKVNRPQMTQK
jgi:hypothetical protein